MALRIGVLMDPIATINSKKDTTLGLLRAASAAGHQLTYLEQADLSVRNGETMASLRPLTVYEDDTACLLYTSPSPRDVEESRMPSSA